MCRQQLYSAKSEKQSQHDSAVWKAFVPRTPPSLPPVAKNHHASLNAEPADQCLRNAQFPANARPIFIAFLAVAGDEGPTAGVEAEAAMALLVGCSQSLRLTRETASFSAT